MSLLKGGLAYADAVTTVSPSYAREILTPERGEALDAFLRWDVKRLIGIVNGIDTKAWDPATDPALPATLLARAARRQGGVPARARRGDGPAARPMHEPLIGVVARMTDQKGLDLVADIVPELHRLGARLVVLGSGEPRPRGALPLARRRCSAITSRCTSASTSALSRRIYAGSDLFVMPSRFEPCGLGQLYAMRYGAIPVVHAVGGLRDTVLDPATLAAERHGHSLRDADARRAARRRSSARSTLFRDRDALATRARAAMARDSSWTASAHQYVQLYRSLRT